jgi:subfamily B ATP-binding cassette protein MsbA
VFDILDTPSGEHDSPIMKNLVDPAGRVTFDQVSFRYDDPVIVLDNISLDIQPGEIVALIGPSGAGKSTMFDLLLGFYDPSQGTVAIDGYDLRHITHQSIRQHIGVVSQDPLLFGGTIRENILYGRLDAREDEIIAAAKAANAHDFIMELPSQYETIVGERGAKLSAGQRQRVTIARVLLKDPRILLLDEATSSLDSETENLVQKELEGLIQGRTTIIIAHRLSTIKIANRIIVLESGKIIEEGTHNELISKEGLYARLHHLQFQPLELMNSTYHKGEVTHR